MRRLAAHLVVFTVAVGSIIGICSAQNAVPAPTKTAPPKVSNWALNYKVATPPKRAYLINGPYYVAPFYIRPIKH